MPTPEICKSYNLSPKEYDDCVNYRGHYSTPAYKHGGIRKVTGVQIPQQKNEGGFLVGPSHEEGGIPAIVGGNSPVELEGGEYIVNAQTVKAVGQPFLDKLNSTQTEYHTGGYGQGQLPNPSQFDRGGKVNKKKKLQTGGVVRHPGPGVRKPASLLREAHLPCPPGMYEWKQACFQMGKNLVNTGNNIGRTGMRKGGKVNSTKKMQTGGSVGNKKLLNTKRNKNNITSRKILRTTSASIGVGSHSHQKHTDVHGNGYTTGGTDHEHNVVGDQVQMACPPTMACHSH